MMTANHHRFVMLLGLALLASTGCKSSMLAERGEYSMYGNSVAGSRLHNSLDPASINTFEQAREMERGGQTTAALERYVQIAEAKPNQPAVWQRMAVAYDKVGHRQYATYCYDRAIELDPMNADIWCDLGYGQFLHGDFESAQGSFRRALDINPNLERAHNNLGLAMAKLGDASSAVEHFRMAGCDGKQAAENLKLARGAPIVAQPEPMPVVMQTPNLLPTMMPAEEPLPMSPQPADEFPVATQPVAELPVAMQPEAELPVATKPLEAPQVMQAQSKPRANTEEVARLNHYATDPSVTKSFSRSPVATAPTTMVIEDDAPKTFSTSIEESFRPSKLDLDDGVYNLISDFEDDTEADTQPPAESKSEVVRRIGDVD